VRKLVRHISRLFSFRRTTDAFFQPETQLLDKEACVERLVSAGNGVGKASETIVSVLLRAFSPQATGAELNDLRLLVASLSPPDKTEANNQLSQVVCEILRKLGEGDRTPPGRACEPEDPMKDTELPTGDRFDEVNLCINVGLGWYGTQNPVHLHASKLVWSWVDEILNE